MREHRVRLTIGGLDIGDESRVERLANSLQEVARAAGPVVDGTTGEDTVHITLAVESEDAAEATAEASRLLRIALVNGAFRGHAIVHAEAELVADEETAAA